MLIQLFARFARLVLPGLLLLGIVVIGMNASPWATPAQAQRMEERRGGGTVPRNEADLAISGTGSVQGSTITFQISVTNNGPVAAAAAVVATRLPATLRVESMSSSVGSCTNRNQLVQCRLGDLGTATAVSITISTSLREPNTAQVSAASAVLARTRDPNKDNNLALVQVKLR